MAERTWVLVVVLASGCSAFAPVVIREQERLPDTFAGQSSADAGAQLDWSAWFGDPQLTTLVDEALAQNQSLAMAVERVELARAGVTRASGALFPRLDLGVGAGVRKYGLYTMDGAGNATTDILPGERVPVNLGDFSLSLQTSWEVDLWGKLRSQRSSAEAQVAAGEEGVRLVMTSLIAEVATTWFTLKALDRTRAVLEKTALHQAEALEVVKMQRSVGRASELAVKQFEAQVLETRGAEAEAAQALAETEARLNALLGRFPRPIPRAALERFELLEDVAVGVPAELLRNRPDVRQAEQQLEAAKFDVTAAQAAFFPSVNLGAAVGTQAFNPLFLARIPESFIYSLLGGLVAPLLNRAALEAQLQGTKALQREAMYNYHRTVLQAYVDVVTALIQRQATAKVLSLKKEQELAVAEMVDTADSLFRSGRANYLEVLLAQQNSLRIELELIESWRRQRIASVTLYRSLGGGWRREAPR